MIREFKLTYDKCLTNKNSQLFGPAMLYFQQAGGHEVIKLHSTIMDFSLSKIRNVYEMKLCLKRKA